MLLVSAWPVTQCYSLCAHFISRVLKDASRASLVIADGVMSNDVAFSHVMIYIIMLYCMLYSFDHVCTVIDHMIQLTNSRNHLFGVYVNPLDNLCSSAPALMTSLPLSSYRSTADDNMAKKSSCLLAKPAALSSATNIELSGVRLWCVLGMPAASTLSLAAALAVFGDGVNRFRYSW